MKLYRHYKTTHWYSITGYAKHTETRENLVLYRMPKDIFFGQVEHNGEMVDRFELHRFYDNTPEAFCA